MFIQKNTRGYWEAWETVHGKRRYVKYIGKDPSSFRRDMERGKELLGKLEDYPDLTLKGGQVALAEHKRRKMPKVKASQNQYRTIVIDPPWPMEKIARDVRPNQFEFDYPVKTIEEIKSFILPAEKSGCHVYLWTTQKFLPIAFDVFETWGVKYECLLTWVKPTGMTPYSWMYNTEFVLFGRIGSLPLLKMGKKLSFEAPVTRHSEKPDIFYNLVEEVSPAPRIDIFARKKRENWDVWGNEV